MNSLKRAVITPRIPTTLVYPLLLTVIAWAPCSTLAESGWRTGYINNNHVRVGRPSIDEIPWDKYTHVIQFAVFPTFDPKNQKPGIDTTTYRFENRAEFIQAAHDNDVKVLFSLLSDPEHSEAMLNNTSPKRIGQFVTVLSKYVTDNGYDGIDIDWESAMDAAQYQDLFVKLRQALPGSIITSAISINKRGHIEPVVDYIDQINLMGYEGDQRYYNTSPIPDTWYHCAVRKGAGQNFGDSATMPSQESNLWYVLNTTSIPAGKLGLGIPFQAMVKQGRKADSDDGVTGPDQSYATGTAVDNPRSKLWYSDFLTSEYAGGVKHWDDDRKVSYMSYDVTGFEYDAFVPFPDPDHMDEFVALKDEWNLGGVMTFSLGQEYVGTESGDARYPLSTAVVKALSESAPNISVGKPATQSTTHENAHAGLAVDGKIDGRYNRGSVSHTQYEPITWWKVDLGRDYPIGAIRVWNRTDNETVSDRLKNFEVQVLDEGGQRVWYTAQVDPVGVSAQFEADGPVGRFVRIQKPGTLHMAEVQVYPKIRNVALNKTATQSTTVAGADASRAVDGDTNGVLSDGSVSHATSDTRAWWKVDLGGTFSIHHINIWNRTDAGTDLLSGFTVVIRDAGGHIVYTSFHRDAPDPSKIVLPEKVEGQYVEIQSAGPTLHMAEVEVYGY